MRYRTQDMGVRLALCGAVISAAITTGSISTAHAVTPSGTAVAVVPSAAAAGTTGQRVLRVDGDVFMGDKVQTGPGGEAQIEFKDSTRLVVGPNSLMTIDAFVFNENNTARNITMNATKGAFRFITGSSAKQAYKINTPTATIGVRGTRFDFTVAPSGEMTFALFEGQARVCDMSGVCRDVRGSCEVVVTPPGGGVDPEAWTVPVAARFPYVRSQDTLLPRFRVNTAGCSSRSAARIERSTPSERTTLVARERTFDPPDPPDNCHGEGDSGGEAARGGNGEGGGYGEGSYGEGCGCQSATARSGRNQEGRLSASSFGAKVGSLGARTSSLGGKSNGFSGRSSNFGSKAGSFGGRTSDGRSSNSRSGRSSSD